MDTVVFGQKLDSAGISFDSVGCANDGNCYIINASQDTQPICDIYVYVFVDYVSQTIANKKLASKLITKYRTNGLLSADELAQLVGCLSFLVIGQ